VVALPFNNALKVRVVMTHDSMDRDAEALLARAKSSAPPKPAGRLRGFEFGEGGSIGTYAIHGSVRVVEDSGFWVLSFTTFGGGKLVYAPDGMPPGMSDVENLVGSWYEASPRFMSA
jgi:hypothetical protein